MAISRDRRRNLIGEIVGEFGLRLGRMLCIERRNAQAILTARMQSSTTATRETAERKFSRRPDLRATARSHRHRPTRRPSRAEGTNRGTDLRLRAMLVVPTQASRLARLCWMTSCGRTPATRAAPELSALSGATSCPRGAQKGDVVARAAGAGSEIGNDLANNGAELVAVSGAGRCEHDLRVVWMTV
jgi:hypothetical protein